MRIPSRDRTSQRPRPRGAGIAVFLYLLTVSLVPVLHASSERLGGVASYEAHHSAQCQPLHDEAVCPTCGAHQTIASPGVVAGLLDEAVSRLAPCPTETVAPPAPATAPPAARAPPR